MVKTGINLFTTVLPANIYMARKELPLGDKQVPKWALYSRLPMQFVLIALVKIIKENHQYLNILKYWWFLNMKFIYLHQKYLTIDCVYLKCLRNFFAPSSE